MWQNNVGIDMLERVKRAKTIDKIVVATSIKLQSNDVIEV